MNFVYKIPGPLLILTGGFCLSWGGLILRSFESASIWQILFYRSIFFLWVLIAFILLTYRKKTFKKIKEAGVPGLIGGVFLSTNFVAYMYSMMETTVANVVFIISTQTVFLPIVAYIFLKEKYGDWIVYEPEVNKNTIFLWGLPLILFIFGGLLIIRKVTIK